MEDQQKIFNPFTQIDSHNFSEEGIGLGLAICYELVKLMNGTLSVNSEINHGSTFNVSLPLPYSIDGSKSAVITQTPSSESQSDKIHVLIAEDNEINIMLISHMLKGLECTFDTAANGAEALNLLCTKDYQLALIDLNMPIMNGFELMQNLRQKNITTPAIAISAYADKDKIKKALSIGFDNYLTKPIDTAQLNKIIKNYG